MVHLTWHGLEQNRRGTLRPRHRDGSGSTNNDDRVLLHGDDGGNELVLAGPEPKRVAVISFTTPARC